MALRAGAFPEKLGHSACSQSACAGKDWCITHPIGQRCTDDQPTIKGRTSANFGYSKPLFACVHRTFGDQFIATARAIFFTARAGSWPPGPLLWLFQRRDRMPAERTIMRQVREVLRLKFVGGVPIREIARRIGVAASTVRATIRRFQTAGLSWPLSEEDLILLALRR